MITRIKSCHAISLSDPKNPPHYKSVFCTPVRNDDGSRRDPDDWQPRAQLKRLFNSSEITLNDTDAIKEYATKLAVDEKYVRSTQHPLLCNTETISVAF